MLKPLKLTTNFCIQYEDSMPDAKELAQAVADTAETDFGILAGWFSITAGFGTSNRTNVYVNRKKGPNGEIGAYNHYYSDDGDTGIWISAEGYPNNGWSHDLSRAFFVAELAEIFASYNMQNHGSKAWDPGRSDGEALSRYCAIERYGQAYYASRIPVFDSNTWMQLVDRTSQNNNWIDKNEPNAGFATEDDPLGLDVQLQSIGCALLFIYYLRDQLHNDIRTVISNGRKTPALTFQHLTGSNDGFAQFTTLLECFFPAAQQHWLLTDDPFPLLGAAKRTVSLSIVPSKKEYPAQPRATSHADRSICGVTNSYRFDVYRLGRTLACKLHLEGFGIPTNNGWVVNGKVLDKTLTQVTVQAAVTMEEPAIPNSTQTTTMDVQLSYSLGSTALNIAIDQINAAVSSTAEVWVEIEIAAQIGDTYCDSATSTSDSGHRNVEWQEAVFEKQYWDDFADCIARLKKFLTSHQIVAAPFDRFNWAIAVRLTLPDPPPPDLVAGVHALRQLAGMARALANAGKAELSREIIQLAGSRLGVSEATLRSLDSHSE